jgi:hypothetical protein
MKSLLLLVRCGWALLALIACALLIALWVRSFYVRDIVRISGSQPGHFRLLVVHGRVVVGHKPFSYPGIVYLEHNNAGAERNYTGFPDEDGRMPSKLWIRQFRWQSGATELHVPIWIPTAIAALIGVASMGGGASQWGLFGLVALLGLLLGISPPISLLRRQSLEPAHESQDDPFHP